MAKNKKIKNLEEQEVIDSSITDQEEVVVAVATEEPQELIETVDVDNVSENKTEASNVEEIVAPVIVKEEEKAKEAINETKPVEKTIVESPKNRSRHDQIQYVFTQPGLVKNSMIHNHY